MGWANGIDLALRERAAKVMPAGVYGHQSVALLPDDYPQFFARAKGSYLWDVDGNQYIDYLCAYGPNLFGYGHDAIDQAYVDQMKAGDTMTGPAAVMVDLAEALTAQVSHAAWALFCKNGTDATTMAMMIARNHSGRRTIIRAKGSYHGAAPWCTPVPAGVTAEDRAHQLFCDYNDVESLDAAVQAAGDDLAAIFATPFKHNTFDDQQLPSPDYAKRARQLCDERGALLVVDDVRAGFRLARDCSWSLVGVQPDLSAWGKAIANGHPLSALLGSERFRAAAASIYATGSYWFSAAAMAASLVTLRLIRDSDYLERTIALGERLRAGLGEAATRHGFGIRQTGPAQMPLISWDDDPAFARSYLWHSALLKRGVYFHPWHNMFLNAAMTEADIDHTIECADAAFDEVRKAPTPLAASKLQRLKRVA